VLAIPACRTRRIVERPFHGPSASVGEEAERNLELLLQRLQDVTSEGELAEVRTKLGEWPDAERTVVPRLITILLPLLSAPYWERSQEDRGRAYRLDYNVIGLLEKMGERAVAAIPLLLGLEVEKWTGPLSDRSRDYDGMIGGMGAAAVPYLIPPLRSARKPMRIAAASALEKLAGNAHASAPYLLSAFRPSEMDEDELVTFLAALKAVGADIGSEEVKIRRLASDHASYWVRKAAADLLVAK
jgi:hypothetical protein